MTKIKSDWFMFNNLFLRKSNIDLFEFNPLVFIITCKHHRNMEYMETSEEFENSDEFILRKEQILSEMNFYG